ncbi:MULTISPECIES: GNAT family N-acetyltransferase [Thermoactinomyces]|uniref:GNAT family N-acetyltransferase n=1 Tax=Thermoactinomyces daqus TaxID=1329516 RepID=A0A7W1XCP3_9BACL|nr:MULTISPECIES: GNAT family N-acetyltransferase [Thermoactinomyces]MBA4544148.1 GNAT family N-acetyltransferase [Thermoactinomyces daqus]MBH8597073.1 GNAT family N-acetyltransferase [Thermoactinomyces sp. CICC 10523]MBH8602633.1 GNAT family N-acetyltransferase [Thermoactinomyces sp. CICC 10522]MBH8606256.1 GNAT family N-acetyltransferase [Thermoactinomyces sp. CICC 10521]
MELVFRIIRPKDAPFLKDFLTMALTVPGDGAAEESLLEKPEHRRYLDNWGQPGDLGFFVALKKEKKPIGAVWFRQFSKEEPGFGFVDEAIPELILAVLPEYQNQGLGRQLLTRLIDQARLEGYPGLSVTVHKNNPAKGLYDRLDFKVKREEGNYQVMVRSFR